MSTTCLPPRARRESSSAVPAAAWCAADARGWLEAEAPGAAAACEPLGYSRPSQEELCRRAATLRSCEIGFIGNPRFDVRRYRREIFADALALGSADEASGRSAAKQSQSAALALPPHLRRLCAAALLTPDQERLLFCRMNFLRYLAAQQRSQLAGDGPQQARVERIDFLLKFADWHRDRIIEANLRLVFSIVKSFADDRNSFEELLSDGMEALMRAVEKFDYDRGFRFSTYATQVIRRNAYRKVVQQHRDRARLTGSIDEAATEPVDVPTESSISEKRWHALRQRLSVMLEQLDRRERLIIRARFSLGSHRNVQTLQRIADSLGVSKERVRQLEKRAMEKLRAMAGDVRLAELDV